jgi:hypothetical protein
MFPHWDNFTLLRFLPGIRSQKIRCRDLEKSDLQATVTSIRGLIQNFVIFSLRFFAATVIGLRTNEI